MKRASKQGKGCMLFQDAEDICIKSFLDFYQDGSPAMTQIEMTDLITREILQLYGEVGIGELRFEILSYESDTKSFSLQTKKEHYKQIWSAMTLTSTYNGQSCAFRILQVTDSLLDEDNDGTQMAVDTCS